MATLLLCNPHHRGHQLDISHMAINYFALQLARKEAALAAAAVERFPNGSALRPARDAAERAWAQTLAALGREHADAALLAMAAEAFMNVSPWDYYQVPGPEP